eukprot:scaffold4676_cov164-Amphora_coffeaeformis.AAC.5
MEWTRGGVVVAHDGDGGMTTEDTHWLYHTGGYKATCRRCRHGNHGHERKCGTCNSCLGDSESNSLTNELVL